MIKRAFIFCSVGFLWGCGAESPTGQPGRLGPTYDASASLANLSEDTAAMPAAHKKNFEAVKRAAAGNTARVKHRKIVRIADDDVSVALAVVWETLPVDGKHLILTATIEALEFSEGTSCTPGEFKRMESSEPFFDTVSVELNCSRSTSSRQHVIGRTLYWNGAKSINEPLIPNGELSVPGNGIEISN